MQANASRTSFDFDRRGSASHHFVQRPLQFAKQNVVVGLAGFLDREVNSTAGLMDSHVAFAWGRLSNDKSFNLKVWN